MVKAAHGEQKGAAAIVPTMAGRRWHDNLLSV